MQDIYLSFQNEAESLPILYTTVQEPIYDYVPIEGQFEQVYTYTYVNPTTGQTQEYQTTYVLTEVNDDYLPFLEEGETVPLTLVKTETIQDTEYKQVGTKDFLTPNYQNISVIGVVYKRAPKILPPDYEPEPYPAPNWGVNVLLLDGEDIEPLKPYIVEPKNPIRVWAT
jgi:hypothetical protein